MMESPEFFMRAALEQARLAFDIGEVPVGAVIVREGIIIASAFNSRETDKSALCHAEIKAIDAACRALGGWRLFMCDMFVTLEPCPMCAGAIVNARIKNLYYGAKDGKAGAFGSKLDLNTFGLNHKPNIVPGILEPECSEILSEFFKKLRC